MADTPNPSPLKKRRWQEIAEELRRRQYPDKILSLAKELNDTMIAEEKQKVTERLEWRLSCKRRSVTN